MRMLRTLSFAVSIAALISPLSAFSKKPHHPDISMPAHITPVGEKIIIVDPNTHGFGAYTADGELVKSGMVTAGGNWCPDIHRRCHTRSGSFRIYSLGGPECKSHRYPLPHGGAPMPYCMFFNGNQALHGSYEVVYGNASHGCVRMHVDDARWLRYNFVEGPTSGNNYRGTRVIVKSY